MRFTGTVTGFRNDLKNKKIFQKTKFQVNYTSDFAGKTLSIADTENEIQFSIPFDEILKIINKK